MSTSTKSRNKKIEAKATPREEGERSVHWVRQPPEEIDRYT